MSSVRLRLVLLAVPGWLLAVAPGARASRGTDLPETLPVDRDAMAEALAADGATPAGPFVSSLALFHYLLGALAADRGDHGEAIAQLRQALVLDQRATHVAVRLAAEYWRLGLGERAEETLRESLAESPRAPEAHEALGTLLLQLDRVEAAERELRRAILLDPSRVDSYRALAQAELRLADEPKLMDCLDAWAKNAPGELGWREFGEAYLERGDLARAERFLQRALTFVPEDPGTLAALGKLADLRHQDDLALSFYERSVRSDPGDGSALFELGRHHLRRAALVKEPEPDRAEARGCFDSMISGADEEAPARAEVGLAYARANLLPEAVQELDGAVAVDPANPRWRYYRGLVLQQLGRPRDAAADFAAVPPSDDTFVDASAKRGEALQSEGLHREAVACLLAALELRPTAQPLYAALSRVYRAGGEGGAAVALLQRVIDQQGPGTEVVVALAEADAALGRREQAIALLRRASRARPTDVVLLFELGSELSRAGQSEEALAQMRRVLELDPHDAAAMNFIGFELAERGQKLDEAEALVKGALSLEPWSGLIADSLGWIYFKQGRLGLAIDTLRRASAQAPSEPVIQEHLGDAYARSGEAREAGAAYGRALELLKSRPDPELRAALTERLELLSGRTAAASGSK
ncbi:MAG: tetratricopeptide repeat protein [Myxococcales bacterium]